ncbi:MAG: leucine-rich repeat protein [Prevotella sp.]|nr:leucine-rich repeat protein [Prevotella sp.]
MKKIVLFFVLFVISLHKVYAQNDVTIEINNQKVSFSYKTVNAYNYYADVNKSLSFGGFQVGDGKKCAIDPSFEGELIIPDYIEVNGEKKPVIGIANNAFKDCYGLVSLTCPAAFIGSQAFKNCANLLSVNLFGRLSFIGRDYDHNIEYTCVAPTIGASAFEGCRNLKTITGSFSRISGSAFLFCENLEQIAIDGEDPYLIGHFKAGFDDIGDMAFGGCTKLIAIHIPAWVKKINKTAFMDCGGLSIITVDSNNSFYDSRDNCNALIETASGLLMKGSENTIIPRDVVTIAEGAFVGVHWNTNGKFPATVTTIEDYAFQGSWIYQTNDNDEILGGIVTLPDGLIKIGQNAFKKCQRLSKINVPHSVTEMGESVFSECKDLQEVDFNPNILEIPNNTFDGCYNLENVSIPNNIESLGVNCFYNCRSLKEIIIPAALNSMKNINQEESNPFIGCTSLSRLEVDKNNKTYDSRNNCNAIIKTSDNLLLVGCKNTIIPNSIKEIGHDAFNWCIGLTEIDLPEGIETIGDGAFSGCINLKTITIPSTVTTLKSGAFGGWYSTTVSDYARTMNIDKTVSNIKDPTDIDNDVFTTTYFSFMDENIGRGWSQRNIDDTYNYGTLYVPMGTKEKYLATEGWKKFKNIVEIDNGKTKKGDVNSDGIVSAADIVDLTIIIGSENDYMRGDINGDGKVDIADVIAVCGIILAK